MVFYELNLTAEKIFDVGSWDCYRLVCGVDFSAAKHKFSILGKHLFCYFCYFFFLIGESARHSLLI